MPRCQAGRAGSRALSMLSRAAALPGSGIEIIVVLVATSTPVSWEPTAHRWVPKGALSDAKIIFAVAARSTRAGWEPTARR